MIRTHCLQYTIMQKEINCCKWPITSIYFKIFITGHQRKAEMEDWETALDHRLSLSVTYSLAYAHTAILCKAKITSSSCWTLQLALLKYISLVQQACKHGSFFSLVVQRLNNAPQNVQSNISITLCMDGRDKYSWSSGG